MATTKRQSFGRLHLCSSTSKASAIRRCKLASHFFTMSIGLTSVTTGLFLCTYNNASPVSLSVAIEVLLQVFRRIRQLNERSQEHDPTGSVSNKLITAVQSICSETTFHCSSQQRRQVFRFQLRSCPLVDPYFNLKKTKEKHYNSIIVNSSLYSVTTIHSNVTSA